MEPHAEPKKTVAEKKPSMTLSESVHRALMGQPHGAKKLGEPVDYEEAMAKLNATKSGGWFSGKLHIDLESHVKAQNAAKEAAAKGIQTGGEGMHAAQPGVAVPEDYAHYQPMVNRLFGLHRERVKSYLHSKRGPATLRIDSNREVVLAMPHGAEWSLGKGNFYLKGERVIVNTLHGPIVINNKIRSPSGH